MPDRLVIWKYLHDFASDGMIKCRVPAEDAYHVADNPVVTNLGGIDGFKANVIDSTDSPMFRKIYYNGVMSKGD